MSDAEFSLKIDNPRYGHDDTYTITFSKDSMTVGLLPRQTTCKWIDGQDPVWQGEGVLDIMQNDSIYAPWIVPDLLVHVWTRWRDGLSTDDAQKELEAVADWINVTTAHKPRSDFWRKYF